VTPATDSGKPEISFSPGGYLKTLDSGINMRMYAGKKQDPGHWNQVQTTKR